jgi:hypothetical protein
VEEQFIPGDACMDTDEKIVSGDSLLLGLLTAFRILVLELSKNGALDHNKLVQALQQTADAHRERGDPNRLADALRAISLQIATSESSAHPDRH